MKGIFFILDALATPTDLKFQPPGLGHQFGRALLKPQNGEERPG